jgi:hypothetical protein
MRRVWSAAIAILLLADALAFAQQPSGECGYYTNSLGHQVPRPCGDATTQPPPPNATAICRDGTYSFSEHHSGTCSGHGGVASFLRYHPGSRYSAQMGDQTALFRRRRLTGRRCRAMPLLRENREVLLATVDGGRFRAGSALEIHTEPNWPDDQSDNASGYVLRHLSPDSEARSCSFALLAWTSAKIAAQSI